MLRPFSDLRQLLRFPHISYCVGTFFTMRYLEMFPHALREYRTKQSCTFTIVFLPYEGDYYVLLD